MLALRVLQLGTEPSWSLSSVCVRGEASLLGFAQSLRCAPWPKGGPSLGHMGLPLRRGAQKGGK